VAVVGIVPAAGRGERLGAERPKAFVACAGRPLIDWSLDVLHATCDRVVVAVPPGSEQGGDRVRGGRFRSESVRLALEAAPEATIAVVHDAARPLITPELVGRCIEAVNDGWDGAIAASRMTDTVKQVSGHDEIERTLDRSTLWRAQTPQVFRADALRQALGADDDVIRRATDDAWLVERAGGRVCVVEAPPDNLKVTSAFDLATAELMLRRRTLPA
jgi:2-C-methyl-D-erythritol 4-phosphate cytidylyltransferase